MLLLLLLAIDTISLHYLLTNKFQDEGLDTRLGFRACCWPKCENDVVCLCACCCVVVVVVVVVVAINIIENKRRDEIYK